MKSTFKILFFIRKDKINADGKSVIYVRLTITLGNGVPIETVSKMLGHTNVRTTQIYARITDQKVNIDMKILADKLNGIFSALLTPSQESACRAQQPQEVQEFASTTGLA